MTRIVGSLSQIDVSPLASVRKPQKLPESIDRAHG
jgi:hypothetical protein